MKKISLCFLAFLFGIILSSCSGVMGYSVLLWNVPEYGLEGGDIVPVYIKSNISHVYVIGVPATSADGKQQKVEVPLWKLTEPEKKGRAVKSSQKYKEFAHTYASVVLDGLPMRAEPVNTAKQVYRLRKNESIKVLYKGKGQAVMAGKNALQGEWLRVLTSDGTVGWCFSYNLRLYEMDKNGQRIGAEEIEKEDDGSEEIETLLTAVWYPESYKGMIDSGRIDVDKINPSYMFHLDLESKKLYFNMPKLYQVWDFTGVTKTGEGQYKINDVPIVLTIRRGDFVVVRYTGESGKPEDYNLVTIQQNIGELVSAERERRASVYRKILSFGPRFKSQSYGTIDFAEDNTFVWNNNRALVPSVIHQSAKNRGSVSVKYFLSKSLSQNYDGVLTFNFDGMEKEVNFLYKIEEKGIRFEDATGAGMRNNILMERSMSPTVIFFTKN